MATVVQSIIEPDKSAIKAHLEALFMPVREIYPDGMIELCHGPEKPNQSSYFGMSDAQIAEAVEFMANRSREGQNCYVGVNPRKPTTNKRRSGTDADIEIAFWHFADLDTAEAVERAREDLPLRPSMVVLTGKTPHNRPHLYWQLEEPVQNLKAWTERQRGIAKALRGDNVIDPRRIMRLAGTVNFPTQAKLQRGYNVELVTIRTEFPSERAPVVPEQIAHAYPAPVYEVPADNNSGGNTLQAMARTRVADLLASCRAGIEWHNHMIRLVAHLAAKGRSSAEIIALAEHITLPGYSIDQTQREMIGALRAARQKWAIEEPQDELVENEEQTRESADAVFELLDMDELEALPPPTWLIHEMIADHGLSILYGEPGAGKSFITLDMALRVAFGMDWHGVVSRQTGVLYIAGEGARGLGKRIKGWRHEHALDGADAPFLLLPVAVQILDEKEKTKLLRTIQAAVEKAKFPIGLVVVDTVSRALAGADENGQEAMSAFVGACADIQQFIGGAIIGVHHSGKDKEKGMRGSTVLLGGCDASIRIEKTDETVTLKTEKQKDAEQAEPIYMTLKKLEWATGLNETLSTLVPIKQERSPLFSADGMSQTRIAEIFNIVEERWIANTPLSMFPQSRSSGRFAPAVPAGLVEVPAATIESYLIAWQESGFMETVQRDNGHGKAGLRVVRRLNDGC